MPTRTIALLILLFATFTCAYAQDEATTTKPGEVPKTVPEEKSPPFLLVPMVSSDPKMGSAGGLLTGYIHKFDAESPPSLFGVVGNYSDTESYKYGAFAKTHFGHDNHRLLTAFFRGEIKNDYEDFQGAGVEVDSTDDFEMFGGRYLNRLTERWYAGFQFITTDYVIIGDNPFSEHILGQAGLTGLKSTGLGLGMQHDTTDNVYSPSSGHLLDVSNMAYRQTFGGETTFDAILGDYQHYIAHGDGNVLGIRLNSRWTNNAPPSGYSSVGLRGYTRGQYLAQHVTTLEVDERISIKGKWGAALFGGVAALYGSGAEEGLSTLYPAAGAGLIYRINEQKMVLRADYAIGKEGNHGFYLKFGQPFNK